MSLTESLVFCLPFADQHLTSVWIYAPINVIAKYHRRKSKSHLISGKDQPLKRALSSIGNDWPLMANRTVRHFTRTDKIRNYLIHKAQFIYEGKIKVCGTSGGDLRTGKSRRERQSKWPYKWLIEDKAFVESPCDHCGDHSVPAYSMSVEIWNSYTVHLFLPGLVTHKCVSQALSCKSEA